MKSKKAQYILLFCTLLVWGLIFYRVFIYLKKDKTTNVGKSIKNQQSENKISSDSLTLLLNYPDPFHLSKQLTTQHSIRKPINIEKKETLKAEPMTPIPKIIYKGIIYKYSKFLPVSNKTPRISLNEGNTPLIHAGYLSSLLGKNFEVYLVEDVELEDEVIPEEDIIIYKKINIECSSNVVFD